MKDIEQLRRDVSSRLDRDLRASLGQFFTPQPIANFMVSLFEFGNRSQIEVLDAGAGIGSLSLALLSRIRNTSLQSVSCTAYEIDKGLAGILQENLSAFADSFREVDRELSFSVLNEDFIKEVAIQLCLGTNTHYDLAILNPPYLKIRSDSLHRRLLRKVRIETVNLYSAFVALSLKLLKDKGQMVAIIPRSFCNGPYYKSFRKLLLQEANIRQIHLFTARNKAFQEDEVLQENLILYLEKGTAQNAVTISTSTDGGFGDYNEWAVPFQEVVKPGDPQNFIRIPSQEGYGALTSSTLARYGLKELGVTVSTGPIVAFRSKPYLLKMPVENSAPLIYPGHFNGWTIHHPMEDFKKYNAIEVNEETSRQLFPAGYYVLIRRFSSKEENRRIVARILRPEDIEGDVVGFENHLNVIHANKRGLPVELAYGLTTYLNSKAVDEYFRLFSGHTQVNATDLRLLNYPSREVLDKLGRWAMKQADFDLNTIDDQVARLL